MDNRPTLFVNTITKNLIGKENQNIFDSRKTCKSKVLHRIDDILSFKYYGKKVYVRINYLQSIFYGEVVDIKGKYIHIKNDESIISILIGNILDIVITTTI